MLHGFNDFKHPTKSVVCQATSNQCIWCHCMPFGVRPENRKTYIRDLFGVSWPVSVAYSVATGVLI